MPAKFTELYENTWVLDDQGVRIFLMAGNEKALVIDTGMNGLPVRELARDVTDLPLILLNTHADPDHIGGNRAFDTFYMHPSEMMVYHHLFHGEGKILPVFDGDRIDLGGRCAEVIHVPGHTPGSITILDREQRCLIGGDPIQADGDIFMFGIHRDMEAYAAGLERLWTRETEFDCVYPSHAKLCVSKEIICDLISGAKEILAGRLQGDEIEMHGERVLCINAGVSRFLCDRK